MIREVVEAMQDEGLLSDELKIIAGERNGLSAQDRQSIRNSALLIDEIMKSYGVVLARLNESETKLAATGERLREANLALAKSNVFPTIGATAVIVGYRV